MRLEVGPLTEEDSMIFILGTRQTWKPAAAMLLYMRADRRDADIMYDAVVRRTGWWAARITRKDRRWMLAFGTALPPERYT